MKKLKWISLSLLLLSFLMYNKTYAEVEADEFEVEYKHYLGAAAGFTTGYGLSYRYVFSRLGVQLTFSPYILEDYKVVSAGVGVIYYLVKENRLNFYLYQANHYHYRYEKNRYYNESDIGFGQWEDYEERNIHNGIGFGFEVISLDRISSNAMIGYAAYNNFSSFSLTGEIALYFSF